LINYRKRVYNTLSFSLERFL